MAIRLVSFDALHTILAPRLPIYVQYSQIFAPFVGVLEPESLKSSFKIGMCLVAAIPSRCNCVVKLNAMAKALKRLQTEKPAYHGHNDGAQGWWEEVIRRTAIGAGADSQAVNSSLHEIVPRLMARFSSREGYKLFDDSLPVLRELRTMNICTALVSNTDSRMHLVLRDLDVASYLNPVILSEETGADKPSSDIFLRACSEPNGSHALKPEQCVHVGDELNCDYRGARAAGMHALLLRRLGPEGEGERKDEGEDLTGVEVINGLWHVIEWVKAKNAIN